VATTDAPATAASAPRAAAVGLVVCFRACEVLGLQARVGRRLALRRRGRRAREAKGDHAAAAHEGLGGQPRRRDLCVSGRRHAPRRPRQRRPFRARAARRRLSRDFGVGAAAARSGIVVERVKELAVG
jgi:hypothetical protein